MNSLLEPCTAVQQYMDEGSRQDHVGENCASICCGSNPLCVAVSNRRTQAPYDHAYAEPREIREAQLEAIRGLLINPVKRMEMRVD